MRYADHGGGGNRRVLVKHLFDLAGVDVEPAPDDQVLLPVDDEVVAVLIPARHVAGAKPAIVDRRVSSLRAVPVALHHVVTFDSDLPHLTLRHVGEIVVDEPEIHSLDRRAD
jgi:hypothetical protein